MALSAFTEKLKPPTPPALTRVLGPATTLWEELKAQIARQYAPLVEEWTFAGKNYGWSLRLKQKKRAVLYLTPCDGYFRAAFALGEKAVAAARASGLPPAVLDLIDAAPRYVEGRAVRLEIRSPPDIAVVLKIAAAKMAT